MVLRSKRDTPPLQEAALFGLKEGFGACLSTLVRRSLIKMCVPISHLSR